MISYKIIWPKQEIRIFDENNHCYKDIYNLDMQYIGAESPIYNVTNCIYAKIINELHEHNPNDEYIVDDIDYDFCDCDVTSENSIDIIEDVVNILDFSRVNIPISDIDINVSQRKSGLDKPLINLVHWWFIDRDAVAFNEVELYHLDKLLTHSVPKCDIIYINVCFDSMDDKYINMIVEYFSQYNNVYLNFMLNDANLCEYNTFQHIYDFKDCYVLYSHFKGVSCMKTENHLSAFCGRTLSDEYIELNDLYQSTFDVHLYDMQGHIFYGRTLLHTYIETIRYVDNYSSRKFYSGSFYCVDINMLRNEIYYNGISRDFTLDYRIYGELLPSLFPLSKMRYCILCN